MAHTPQHQPPPKKEPTPARPEATRGAAPVPLHPAAAPAAAPPAKEDSPPVKQEAETAPPAKAEPPPQPPWPPKQKDVPPEAPKVPGELTPAAEPPKEDKARPVRILRVPRELLVDVLHLPPGTKVVDVSSATYFDTDELAFKVESPDFPPVPDGQAVPVVKARFREERHAVFDGWTL